MCKLEGVVEGMKITDKGDLDVTYVSWGNMSQHRSREPDEWATCPLEFVHCDLAGAVDPKAKGWFQICIVICRCLLRSGYGVLSEAEK